MRSRRLSRIVFRVAAIVGFAIAFCVWRRPSLFSWPPMMPKIARPYAAYVPGGHPERSPVEEVRALDLPLSASTIVGPTFEAALALIREKSTIDFFINWTAIEHAGITRDVPVSLDVSGMKVGNAISATLAAADGNTRILGFSVDGGTVVLTTHDEAAMFPQVTVYDVRDLLVGANPRTAVSELQSRLEKEIAPDTWKSNGGLIGDIQELGGELIVTQTPENQLLIDYDFRRHRWWRAWLHFATEALPIVGGATGIAIAVELILWRRRVKDIRRRGLCPSCEYDLRATTDRCPECGATIDRPHTRIAKRPISSGSFR